ncbi:hypothetical protein BH09GEM1_BH09GEM1_45080 [soil metagenome]
MEAAFAVLTRSGGFQDIDVAIQTLRVVNAYVVGAIQRAASELPGKSEGGMSEKSWHTATAPYVHRMLDTGRYPNLTRVHCDATPRSSEALSMKGSSTCWTGSPHGSPVEGARRLRGYHR